MVNIKELHELFRNKLEISPKSRSSIVLRDIASFLTKPGLINIEVNDLNKLIHSSKRMIAMSAKARGNERSHIIGRKIVANIGDMFRDKKATNVLFNITGSPDLTLYEVNEVAEYIYNIVAADANIIFGAVIDEKKKDYVNATVIFGSK